MVRKRVRPYKDKVDRITAKTLSLLSQNLTIKQIANVRNCSRRNVQKLFSAYQRKGLITPQRELTERGKEVVRKVNVVSDVVPTQQPDRIRLHDTQFTVRILKPMPRKWDEHRQKALKIKKYIPKEWMANGVLFQEFLINNVRVRTTNKSILILPDDIYAGTPREAVNRAVRIVWDIIPRLERLFSIKLSKPSYCNINLTRQHHAIIFNEIAKQFLAIGIPLKIYDNKGELRLIIDDSEKLKELEAVHVVHSEDDAEAVKNFLRDITLNEHYAISDLSKKMSEVISSLEVVVRTSSTTTKQLEVLTKSQIALTKKLEAFFNIGKKEEMLPNGKPNYFG